MSSNAPRSTNSFASSQATVFHLGLWPLPVLANPARRRSFGKRCDTRAQPGSRVNASRSTILTRWAACPAVHRNRRSRRIRGSAPSIGSLVYGDGGGSELGKSAAASYWPSTKSRTSREWSRTVKGLWDSDRDTGCPLKVIILGSAPWALLTGRGESLAGRFTPFDVRHWSLSEMVDAFDFTFDEYIYFGGYPGAAPLIRDLGEWRQYVAYSIIAPVFGRDILALTRVDKPSLMRQLVDLVPDYSGQIVRYDHLVGRLRGTGHTTTVAHYLGLLSDAGIVAQLPKYSGSAVRRSESNPKLNVLNTGLMTALSGYSLEQARADRTFWGRLVESAVGAHLHNTLEVSMRLSYWRDDPFEVDFVLSQGPRVLGIGVKSSGRVRSLPGLRAFNNRFPRAEALLVTGTGDAGQSSFGNQRSVPINEFLAAPASYWLEEAL